MPREADPSFESVVVLANDGMRFGCSIAWVGRQERRRWIFVDADGVDYVGPEFPADTSTPTSDELLAIVNEWWATKKELGQAAINPRLLRRRSMSLDN